MKLSSGKNIIYTIKEKCRVCYTCVRECPAKAIKIVDGQAEVLGERCIGCGNCVKVCSQNAKKVLWCIEGALNLLKSGKKTAAIIAPSFPAEFEDIPYKKIIGAIEKIGFDYIHEVGFAADVVAREYKKILKDNPDKSYISSSCPAVVSYVEKYHPELIDNLMPVVSPMIAEARILKKKYKDVNVVFIGPCIAKKGEKIREELLGEVDTALTFQELRELFAIKNIDFNKIKERDFDKPHAFIGGLFPISRGILQTADIKEDLIESNVVSADGKNNLLEAIKEFKKGFVKTKLLDVLCCEGCIMGAGIKNKIPLYKKRYLVSSYVNERKKLLNKDDFNKELVNFSDVNYRTKFSNKDQRIPQPSDEEIEQVLKIMGKKTLEDELNCGACGYETCREHSIAILKGLAENEMCLPYSIEKLKYTVSDLEKSYSELKRIKDALNHREKLASMGQLAAGIAHEVNNPLGIVIMYAHILKERFQDKEDLSSDITMIVEQADRCKKIVSGLLNFARQSRIIREPVNAIKLLRNCLEAINIPKNIRVNFIPVVEEDIVEIDKEQMTQVLINVLNNAIDAMEDRKEKGELNILITSNDNWIKFMIADNGAGIPEKYKNKIFDPFFTTKQLGKGTGLGLPVSYGIIKMHSGDIKIESNGDLEKGPTGTKVIITLPRKEKSK